jgi:hypothetical protein
MRRIDLGFTSPDRELSGTVFHHGHPVSTGRERPQGRRRRREFDLIIRTRQR